MELIRQISTPLLSGITIGVAVSGTTLLLGRVTGISGIWKGALKGGSSEPFDRLIRFSFIGGLAIAASFLGKYVPSSVAIGPGDFLNLAKSSPESSPWLWLRLICGAAAVGAGTALANGCTSGHGVCGIARESSRSLSATLTFMAVASATSTLTGTLPLLQKLYSPENQGPIDVIPPLLPAGVSLLGSFVFWQLYRLGYPIRENAAHPESKDKAPSSLVAFQAITSLVSGFLFGLGLGFGGMTQAIRVIEFLDVFSPFRQWSPNLACVMGGAVGVSWFGFRSYNANNKEPKLALKNLVPTTSIIDFKLLSGAALFGLGWGLTGICPGPMLVSTFAHPFNLNSWAFVSVLSISALLIP